MKIKIRINENIVNLISLRSNYAKSNFNYLSHTVFALPI